MQQVNISEIQIVPVKPANGLVGFASVVLNDSLYLGSMAVYTRPGGTGYRIVYPTKKTGTKSLNLFHPINAVVSQEIEHAIAQKCAEIFEVE